MCLEKRNNNILIVFVFVFSITNISCHECVSGVFDYNTKVRVVDEAGIPLVGIKVTVQRSDDYVVFTDVQCDCDCGVRTYCRSTDEDGYAVVAAGLGNKWSYCSPDKKPGPPPRPKKLYPWIEYPKDNWTMYEVDVTNGMIEEDDDGVTLFIDLGTITINTDSDTDTVDTNSDGNTTNEVSDGGADASS